MKIEKSENQEKHQVRVFLCCNEKAEGASCAAKGAREMREDLKKWVNEAGLHGKVRINQSGCLGKCSQGIAAVSYPSGEWATEIQSTDLNTFKEWVKAGVAK